MPPSVCRQGRHNPGNWKPADPFTGASAVAHQLVHLNSTLELIFVIFPGDGSEARCSQLREELVGQLRMTCHAADGRLPQGYGVAKVEAVIQAPVNEAIWLDCDAFPLVDLVPLLADPSYVAPCTCLGSQPSYISDNHNNRFP
jgi:hypothetical protein